MVMNKNDSIREALADNLSGLYLSADMHASLLHEITGGKKMKRKLTVGLICLIILLLVTAAALAVTAVQTWLNSVSQMQVDGIFFRWDLSDKLRFVEALKDAGYAVDEALYETLANTALDDKKREAAADQIVDACYGDAMREQAKDWIQTPATMVGMAPDPVIIFREAYYAEHPNATEQEYIDALAYWIRDTARRLEAEQEALGLTQKPQIDEAYAISCVKTLMTEVLSWSQTAADHADIRAAFDKKYEAWVCTGSVTKESLADSFEPITSSEYVGDLGDAYETRLVVDKNGRVWGHATLEEYIAQAVKEPIWNYTGAQCEKIALHGVMSLFGLSAEQADRYFLISEHQYTDKDQNAVLSVLFKEHSNGTDSQWTYAAIVNAGTGELIDCFNAKMLWERLPHLAAAYPKMTEEEKQRAMAWYTGRYGPEGGYTGWPEERKAQWDALFGQ